MKYSNNPAINPKTKEFAHIIGISDVAVRKNPKKYPVEPYTSTKGNKGYYVVIDRLSEELQREYWTKKLEYDKKRLNKDIPSQPGVAGNYKHSLLLVQGKNSPISCNTINYPQQDLTSLINAKSSAEGLSLEERRSQGIELYQAVPAYDRKRADLKLDFCTYIKQFGAYLRGREFQKALDQWNKENPDKTMKYSTAWNAYKLYNQGYVGALLTKYRYNRGRTTVPDDDFCYWKTLFLTQSRTSVNDCWVLVVGRKRNLNPEFNIKDFPTAECFKRRLDNEMSKAQQDFHRLGPQKWAGKWANYVERNYTKLIAGQLWVSDHVQLDIIVKHNNGKTVRPWATVWSDAKTRRILSCYIHVEPPNSDHIFLSFYHAVLKYGKPASILIDNGKDYRCRDFGGGRKTIHKVQIEEYQAKSMLNLIGVIVYFALPYNPQSKPIERIFKQLHKFIEKFLLGYCGSNIVDRPEKLKDEIKKGEILEFEELKRIYNELIEEVYNNTPSQSKALKGKSPNQAWAEEFTTKQYINKEELRLFCMRSSNDVTIGKNGVKDSKLNVHYWGDWMSAEKGRKAYLRRDIENPIEAWIYDANTHEFIGNAEMVEKVDFLAKDEAEVIKLQTAIARNRADIKFNKAAKPKYERNITEMVEDMKAGALAQAGSVPEANPEVIKYSSTKMTGDIKKAQKLKEEGTFDITKLKCERPQKEVLHLTATAKDMYEREQKRMNSRKGN